MEMRPKHLENSQLRRVRHLCKCIERKTKYKVDLDGRMKTKANNSLSRETKSEQLMIHTGDCVHLLTQ